MDFRYEKYKHWVQICLDDDNADCIVSLSEFIEMDEQLKKDGFI